MTNLPWTNRTVMHGRYGPQITLEEAYEDGLDSGRGWDHPWVPGGPHVTEAGSSRHRDDPDWIAFCEHSRRVHDEWMRGWREGRAWGSAAS